MKRETVWLIAVLGLVALWGAAAAHKARPIERQIASEAVLELGRRGLERRFEFLAFDVDGRTLKIVGTALSEADKQAALEAAGRVQGVSDIVDHVRLAPEVKPFTFRAVRNADGSASLAGEAPSRDAMDRLTQLGRSVFGNQIIVSLRLARGAPEGDWFAAAKAAVEVIALVSSGEAVLTDRHLAVTGQADDDAAIDSVASMLRGAMPPGYTARPALVAAVDNELRGPPLADVRQCQGLVNRVAPSRAVRFEAGSTTLLGVPPRLLDRLAQAMARCARLSLEIYAAADTYAGDPADNLKLSEARAVALEDALARRGVDRSRMVALGRGRLDPRERTSGPDVEFRIAANIVPVVRPYVWAVEKAKGGGITTSGYYPSSEEAASLAAAVREALGEGARDAARPGRGAPPGDWIGAARLAASILAQLDHGRVALADYNILVRGVVRDDATAKAVETAAVERTPNGFHLKFELRTALDEALDGRPLTAAEQCQAQFDDVLRTGVVVFELDGPALFESQRLLFGRLAAAVRRCPHFAVEVAGHATGTGEPEASRVLSERWAQAVVDAVVRAGAERERLRAAGYGNTKPLVDAKTEAGRQRNRRIEFRVIP